jgi:hypothetical protein
MSRPRLLIGVLLLVLALSGVLALQPDEQPVELAAPLASRRNAAAQALPARPSAAAVAAPARSASAVERMPWVALSPEALPAWSAPAPPPQPVRPSKPAAAPAAAPAPPEKPPLPAFPYRWIGQLTDEQGVGVAMLASAQRSVAARAGDVLDGNWRIEAVADDQVHITWLPTGDDLTLNKR